MEQLFGSTSATRTSEPTSSPAFVERFGVVQESQQAPTLPLGFDEPDPIAISFALERDRVLRRSEHTAAVHRFERALSMGFWLWLSPLVIDWWIVQHSPVGNLRDVVAVRIAGALAVLFGLWRLRRAPEPSPRLLWWLDVGIVTFVCTLGGLLMWSSGGTESAYFTGLVVILVARGATTLAPWRRGAWLFGIPALAFPLVLLIAVLVDDRVRAQFADPAQLGKLIMFLVFVAMTWLLLTLGGDFAWRLRREAIETRNIGRYKLERHIGRGGMGNVWAAYDLALKHRVALKTVSGQRGGSLALVRFEREARALAELKHPNTVRVFDYGVTDDGLWYFAMELLEGENLHDLVARSGPLCVERLVHIARQVLRALGEAHAKGIIHRDIKPENVFVAILGGEPDVVKLLDFGIAKAPMDIGAKLTVTGTVTGTPAYMPSEVLLGHPADVRSDIFCFGVTLFFAASGKLPFSDRTQLDQLAARLNGDPPLLSEATATLVSPLLESVVRRCMATDPRARYGSVHEVLDALAELS